MSAGLRRTESGTIRRGRVLVVENETLEGRRLAETFLEHEFVAVGSGAHSGHRDHAFRRIAIGAKRRFSRGLGWSLWVLGGVGRRLGALGSAFNLWSSSAPLAFGGRGR
jgi:hypothetical protein